MVGVVTSISNESIHLCLPSHMIRPHACDRERCYGPIGLFTYGLVSDLSVGVALQPWTEQTQRGTNYIVLVLVIKPFLFHICNAYFLMHCAG